MFEFTPKKAASYIIIAVLAIFVIGFAGSIIEINDAGWYRVNQALTGKMSVRQEPGPYIQMFAKVHAYKKVMTEFLSARADEGGAEDTRIRIRFQDGGWAKVEGNVRYKMPARFENQLKLHSEFRSRAAVAQKLLQPAIVEALQLTAVMMTSEESYATRAAEFRELAEDQLKYGIYKTVSKNVKKRNLLTGETEEMTIKKIKLDKDGNPMRKIHALEGYGIEVAQLIIKDIDYEEKTQQLISAKKESLMLKVKSQADAVKAKQQAITAEANGKKEVMEEKYKQEKMKIKAVVKAEEQLEVAKLERKAAFEYKQKKILQAEGDAAYKRKVMQADGALQQKLATYEKVQQIWASAVAKQKWVPEIQMGGSANTGSGAQTLVDMLTAKTAKELSLNMGMRTASRKKTVKK